MVSREPGRESGESIGAVVSGPDGGGSGGTIYFAGYLDDPVRLLDGGLEHIQYQLHNVLWLFERNPFKQYRNQFAGWTVPGDPSSGASYVKKVCPEIYLGDNWSAAGRCSSRRSKSRR
jgi:hypothetical protein